MDSTTGVVSGTPSAVGTSTGELVATDAVGDSATEQLTMVIAPVPTVEPSTATEGVTVGDLASIPPPEVVGGTGPFHWQVTGLPASLSISPTTGTISGTATTADIGTGTAGQSGANRHFGQRSGRRLEQWYGYLRRWHRVGLHLRLWDRGEHRLRLGE